jgi:glyoxylase-like metal-dependent hydrolase (beta-lactamase superfamily II)
MQIGDIHIQGISDGSLLAPPTFMFNKTAEDWEQHSYLLDGDGMLVMEMGGFVVRTGERLVLIDAGLGPHGRTDRTGTFMKNLAAAGIQPGDITDVMLTHLHFDHLGWASDGEKPLFPNAVYRCHGADWDFFMGSTPYDESPMINIMGGRPGVETLPPLAEKMETWSGDANLLPGIDVRSAPGHTPGSTVIVISSGDERALLLGDAVHCPAELLTDDWESISDVDKELALRTRVALAQELEGTGTLAAASHFPGLQFGRLLAGTGVRRWVFD